MQSQNPQARVCVILVNWNGWHDTIDCLTSLLNGTEKNFQLVVCDNDSRDDSITHLRNWANETGLSHRVISLNDLVDVSGQSTQYEDNLILVPAGSNLGFAGGCNIGLRYAQASEQFSHVWLLNNDTIVDANCLSAMLQAAREDDYDRPIGCKIYDLDGERKLQVYGGQKLGIGPLISPRHCMQPKNIDYLVGASIFMSIGRLNRLGLMNEKYFLNAEDLVYTLGYQRDFLKHHPNIEPFLVVGCLWHRESSSQGRNKFLHTYYYSRNLLLVAREEGFLSYLLTSVHAILRTLKALLLLRLPAAKGISIGILHALLNRYGPYPGQSYRTR